MGHLLDPINYAHTYTRPRTHPYTVQSDGGKFYIVDTRDGRIRDRCDEWGSALSWCRLYNANHAHIEHGIT